MKRLCFLFWSIAVIQSLPVFSQLNPSLRDSLLMKLETATGKDRFYAQIKYLEAKNYIDPEGKANMLEEAREWSRNKGDTLDRLIFDLVQSKEYFQKGETAKALRNALRVERSSHATPLILTKSQVVLRDFYYELGAYEHALPYHQKIKWENATDHWERFAPNSFLAFLFLKLKDYPKSIQYLKESVHLMHDQKMIYWEISYTNSLGYVYELSGQLDSAWSNYQRALDLLDSAFISGKNIGASSYDFITGLIYGNMAQVLAKRDKHLQAIPLYKRDIESSLKDLTDAEYKKNAITSILKLTKSLIATNQKNETQHYLRLAQSLLGESKPNELWIQYWNNAWSYYEISGKKDSALYCARKYTETEDSLGSVNNAKSAQDLLVAYEATVYEKKLKEKEAEMKALLVEAESEKQGFRIAIFSIILLAIALIASYMVIRSRKIRERTLQEKSFQIEFQKGIISESLKEKDVLLKEVHHRVKNNLQIISSLFYLQSKKVTDPMALEAIRESQLRIQTMSVIHQKLYQADQLDLISFEKYIKDLAEQIVILNKPADLDISLVVNAEDIPITVDKAVPIGLVINELVTNSLKHGFKDRKDGKIEIKIYLNELIAHLVYKDNGVGADLKDLEEKTDSLGMKLIRLFIDQLDGKMAIHSENGIVFDFQIPMT